MRVISILLFLTFFISCDKENNCDLDQNLSFQNFEMRICSEMTHNPMQGIDTEIGELISSDPAFKINYDIGYLAGLYVEEQDSTKLIGQAENHEFWYKVINDQIIITFPFQTTDSIWDYNPVNFSSTDIMFEEEILDIMRTIRKTN